MKSSDINDVGSIAEKIDGWLGKREGPYLYALAKRSATPGVIVEIGSWKGKSTVWLAKGSESVKGPEIFAIDPHVGGPDLEKLGLFNVSTEAEFLKNMRIARVDNRVHAIVKSSCDALKEWREPVGLLWIDGDHSYENVSQDFYGWIKHLTPDGIVAFHDTYSWEGVRRLVDDEVLLLKDFKVLGQVDGILAIQKVNCLGIWDQMRRVAVRRLRGIYNRARVRRYHWRALPRRLLRSIAVPRIPI